MSKVTKISHLPGFRPTTAAPRLAYYAAVFGFMDGVAATICRHDSVPAVVDLLRSKGEALALIVPSRLCTKRSIALDANRLMDRFPLVDGLIALNPQHERIVASPIVFGHAPTLTVEPRGGPTPPPATPAPVPAHSLDVAELDVADAVGGIAA